MSESGKILVFIGLMLILIGGVMMLTGRLPGVGKLPGDIFIKRGNFFFYFPLATSLLLSLILTFIFFLIHRR
ncbi:MAG: DUF2905 domain-containing protein [Candidatus Omnitrophota bacterium]